MTATATQPATEPKTTATGKTTQTKTPWARRREMDFSGMLEKLAKNIALVKKVKAEAFDEHDVKQSALLDTMRAVQENLAGLSEAFAQLPDDFPPRRLRVQAQHQGFTEGATVRVRENRREKYVGAFDPAQTLTVATGRVGGSYVPIKTTDGRTFFVPQAHLIHVPE